MPVSFACPNPACRRSVLVAEDQRGGVVCCPHCQQTFRTPMLTDSTPVTRRLETPHPPPAATLNDPPPTAIAPSATLSETPPTAEVVRIGRFEVRQRLGEGAFGVVHLAYDPQLDREVALKVAKVEMLATPQR